MEMVQVQIGVAKEAYEAGLMIGKIIKEAKLMAKDGLNQDDIAKAVALMVSKEVIDGLQGLDKIDDEARENKSAVIAAGVVALVKALE